MSDTHPVDQLWSAHHPPHGYPPGVEAVPKPIEGLAFFPGGWGLWKDEPTAPLPPVPIGGVMILGHDFHSRGGYDKSFQAGEESQSLPTWRNLLPLLDAVEIERPRCFFTNIYMGLRSGTHATGTFPGASDTAFRRHCQDFFLTQLEFQRPALILTLGVHVPPVIGELSDQLTPWAQKRGIKHIDAVGALRTQIQFRGLANFTTTVAALLHPSLRHPSLHHRRYTSSSGLTVAGNDAELALLRDAVAASR